MSNALLVCKIHNLHKIWERKGKTLTKNWRDHRKKGTCKQTATWSKYFDGHSRLSQSEENVMPSLSCVHIHSLTLFWLRRMAVTIEIFWLTFRVFACSCPTVISSIFGNSFHFPFSYFVLIYNKNNQFN